MDVPLVFIAIALMSPAGGRVRKPEGGKRVEFFSASKPVPYHQEGSAGQKNPGSKSKPNLTH